MDTGALLIHCRQAPYGHSLARAGIELAMAAAAFEQPVALLFSGDGVWQLIDHQNTRVGEKNHSKLVSALPIYGIAEIFIDSASLVERQLTPKDLCIPVVQLDKTEIATLLTNSGQVFTF